MFDSNYGNSPGRAVPVDRKPSVKGTLGQMKQSASWSTGIASWTIKSLISSPTANQKAYLASFPTRPIYRPPMWKNLVGRYESWPVLIGLWIIVVGIYLQYSRDRILLLFKYWKSADFYLPPILDIFRTRSIISAARRTYQLPALVTVSQ